ncbi:hypothetical protein [Aureimonas sp. AU4]|uniref:hypothetical protein n=1 Tax=Aureimonas sp. AU4 TaxID=1638163 RepID=UPI000B27489A|nr:hypothetical protein [Aureimonas sp. AU4]
MTPFCILRHGICTDMGPAWLRLDDATEYKRAMYPTFLDKAKDSQLIIAGSTAATFRSRKVPAGYATVASGFDLKAGDLIGSDKVTLTLDNIPANDHSYVDAYADAKTQTSGLLCDLVTIMLGLTVKTADKTTGKAGKANPNPVPIKPLGFVAHLFVFAKHPQAQRAAS